MVFLYVETNSIYLQRLMGFPDGYVSKAGELRERMRHPWTIQFTLSNSLVSDCLVDQLFTTILNEGLEKRFVWNNWKQHLDKKYHHFSGDYSKFKGELGSTFCFVEGTMELKMAQILSNTTVSTRLSCRSSMDCEISLSHTISCDCGLFV